MKTISSALLFLSCGIASAGSMGEHCDEPNSLALNNGYVVLQGGGYWNSQGKAQHINIVGLVGNDLTINNHQDSNGLAGLGYFLYGNQYRNTQLSYGLNVFYLANTSVSGDVIQESLFKNLSYNYHTAHIPLYAMVSSKTPLPKYDLSLIVDVGIGADFMRASDFKESSLDGGITIPDNPFINHATTTIGATVGVGLQLANLFNIMPVECGYRFFYADEGRFARRTNQLIDTLHTDSMYANALVCGLRYNIS